MSDFLVPAVWVAVIVGLIYGALAEWPVYNVYASRLSGEARLAEAESSRQVAVREAQAKKDSAVLLAEAEVLRADGVAKANKIIGDSLKGNEDYLRYLWIDKLGETKDQIIYIPTEAGLPLLEANRLGQARQ